MKDFYQQEINKKQSAIAKVKEEIEQIQEQKLNNLHQMNTNQQKIQLYNSQIYNIEK
jgi:hypothetical protein